MQIDGERIGVLGHQVVLVVEAEHAPTQGQEVILTDSDGDEVAGVVVDVSAFGMPAGYVRAYVESPRAVFKADPGHRFTVAW